MSLVKLNRLSHSGSDVKRFDVVPAFFKQRNQVIDRHVNIGSNLLFSESVIGNGNSQAKDFFQLKFNWRQSFFNPGFYVVVGLEDSREFSPFGEERSSQFGQLFQQSFRNEEQFVFGGPFFEFFSFLVCGINLLF